MRRVSGTGSTCISVQVLIDLLTLITSAAEGEVEQPQPAETPRHHPLTDAGYQQIGDGQSQLGQKLNPTSSISPAEGEADLLQPAETSPHYPLDRHWLPTDRGRTELVGSKANSYKQHLTGRGRSRSPRARRDLSPSPDRYGLPTDGDGKGPAQDSDGSLSPAFNYDHTEKRAVSPVTQPSNSDLIEPSERVKLQQRGPPWLKAWIVVQKLLS